MQERPWRGRVDFREALRSTRRMPPSGACRAHILGTFKAVRVDLKLFYRGFLLYPASQLYWYCGAGGAFGPSGEANGDT